MNKLSLILFFCCIADIVSAQNTPALLQNINSDAVLRTVTNMTVTGDSINATLFKNLEGVELITDVRAAAGNPDAYLSFLGELPIVPRIGMTPLVGTYLQTQVIRSVKDIPRIHPSDVALDPVLQDNPLAYPLNGLNGVFQTDFQSAVDCLGNTLQTGIDNSETRPLVDQNEMFEDATRNDASRTFWRFRVKTEDLDNRRKFFDRTTRVATERIREVEREEVGGRSFTKPTLLFLDNWIFTSQALLDHRKAQATNNACIPPWTTDYPVWLDHNPNDAVIGHGEVLRELRAELNKNGVATIANVGWEISLAGRDVPLPGGNTTGKLWGTFDYDEAKLTDVKLLADATDVAHFEIPISPLAVNQASAVTHARAVYRQMLDRGLGVVMNPVNSVGRFQRDAPEWQPNIDSPDWARGYMRVETSSVANHVATSIAGFAMLVRDKGDRIWVHAQSNERPIWQHWPEMLGRPDGPMRPLTVEGTPVNLVFEREFANGRMLLDFNNGNVWIVPEPGMLELAAVVALFGLVSRKTFQDSAIRFQPPPTYPE